MRGYVLLATVLVLAAAPGLADTGYGSAYIGALMEKGAFDDWYEWKDNGIEHPTVRMAEEYVDIYLHRAEATVFAEFVFENGGEATTVPMVYPTGTRSRSEGCADFEVFVEVGNGDWEPLPFTVEAAGLNSRRANAKFARFDVAFEAGERKRVKCSYVAFYGFSAEVNYITCWGREGYDELWDENGEYKKHPGLLPRLCPYILSTGATWAGPIGRGRIAFHPTAELTWEDLTDSDGVAYINRKKENPHQWGCMSRGAAFTEFLERHDVAVTIDDGAIVFTFEDLEPAGPEEDGLLDFEEWGLPLAAGKVYLGDVRASSQLPAEGDVDYRPHNVVLSGGGFRGPWVEGVNGDGVGEWVRMRVQPGEEIAGAPDPMTLGGVHFYGGYHSASPDYSADLFYRNGAPSAVTVAAFLSGKEVFRRAYDLAELSAADPASRNIGNVYLSFDGQVKCDELAITIDAVRPGSEWDDTCISGVFPVEFDDRLHCGASSVLVEKPHTLCRFHPIKAGDGRADTCWVEGAEGGGVGEWLEISFPESRSVGGLEVMSGFAGSDETWRANGRPAELRVALYREGAKVSEEIITLEDTRDLQEFFLKAGTLDGITAVRFTITEAYAGEKYEDTCISEIKLF